MFDAIETAAIVLAAILAALSIGPVIFAVPVALCFGSVAPVIACAAVFLASVVFIVTRA